VKRTGRSEPVGVVIYICMETTKGISLCSYFYLKLAKPSCFSYLLCFSSTKSENRRVDRFRGKFGGVWHQWERGGGGERDRRMNTVQIMCIHVCKCENDTC
jgi:hypothetical protein